MSDDRNENSSELYQCPECGTERSFGNLAIFLVIGLVFTFAAFVLWKQTYEAGFSAGKLEANAALYRSLQSCQRN